MVEGIEESFYDTFDDELSEIALEQVVSENKEISMIIPVIQWLRAVVFVLLGAILCK